MRDDKRRAPRATSDVSLDGDALVHRERRATGTQGNRLFVKEEVTTLDPATRQQQPGFPKTEVNLVIDQKTREYLPGSGGGRVGGWGLPFNVEKGRSYSAWVSDAQRPLAAEYLKTERVDGLKTFVHLVDAKALPLGVNDPATGLPLVFDARIRTWSEPRTGTTVKFEDYDAVSALGPGGIRFPRFAVNLNSTQESVAVLVRDARSNRSKLVWFGSYIPWAAIGAGIALAGVALALFGASPPRRSRGSHAATPRPAVPAVAMGVNAPPAPADARGRPVQDRRRPQ